MTMRISDDPMALAGFALGIASEMRAFRDKQAERLTEECPGVQLEQSLTLGEIPLAAFEQMRVTEEMAMMISDKHEAAEGYVGSVRVRSIWWPTPTGERARYADWRIRSGFRTVEELERFDSDRRDINEE